MGKRPGPTVRIYGGSKRSGRVMCILHSNFRGRDFGLEDGERKRKWHKNKSRRKFVCAKPSVKAYGQAKAAQIW